MGMTSDDPLRRVLCDGTGCARLPGCGHRRLERTLLNPNTLLVEVDDQLQRGVPAFDSGPVVAIQLPHAFVDRKPQLQRVLET